MKQRHITTGLAIIVVTGAVSLPNSLAMAWQPDLSSGPIINHTGSTWDSLIHRVADIHDPSNESWPQNENYGRYSNQFRGLRENGASRRAVQLRERGQLPLSR